MAEEGKLFYSSFIGRRSFQSPQNGGKSHPTSRLLKLHQRLSKFALLEEKNTNVYIGFFRVFSPKIPVFILRRTQNTINTI
jgi:hypothetical protein